MNEDGKAYYLGSASVQEFMEMELKALAARISVDFYDPIQQRHTKYKIYN